MNEVTIPYVFISDLTEDEAVKSVDKYWSYSEIIPQFIEARYVQDNRNKMNLRYFWEFTLTNPVMRRRVKMKPTATASPASASPIAIPET